MTKLRRTIVALAVVAQLSGCAAVLSTIIAAAPEILNVLALIDSNVQRYFEKNPDAEKKVKYDEVMAQTRAGLNTALHATKGVEKLTQRDVDNAFKDFAVAYTQLVALVQSFGVVSVQQGGKLSASPGVKLNVPTAEALVPRV